MLTQHSKTFGKQKQSGKDVLFTSSSKGENSKGRGRGHGKGRSQGRSNNFQGSNFQQGSNSLRRSRPERPQNQNNQTIRDMSQITCIICNRVGHFAVDCRTSNNKLPKYNNLQIQHSMKMTVIKGNMKMKVVLFFISPTITSFIIY